MLRLTNILIRFSLRVYIDGGIAFELITLERRHLRESSPAKQILKQTMILAFSLSLNLKVMLVLSKLNQVVVPVLSKERVKNWLT